MLRTWSGQVVVCGECNDNDDDSSCAGTQCGHSVGSSILNHCNVQEEQVLLLVLLVLLVQHQGRSPALCLPRQQKCPARKAFQERSLKRV